MNGEGRRGSSPRGDGWGVINKHATRSVEGDRGCRSRRARRRSLASLAVEGEKTEPSEGSGGRGALSGSSAAAAEEKVTLQRRGEARHGRSKKSGDDPSLGPGAPALKSPRFAKASLAAPQKGKGTPAAQNSTAVPPAPTRRKSAAFSRPTSVGGSGESEGAPLERRREEALRRRGASPPPVFFFLQPSPGSDLRLGCDRVVPSSERRGFRLSEFGPTTARQGKEGSAEERSKPLREKTWRARTA